MPTSYNDRTSEILDKNDSIESFTKSKMKITNKPKDVIRRSTIFEIYKSFCDQNSQRCKPRSTLFNRLSHLKISTIKLNGYDVFRGIKIVDGDGDDDDENDDEAYDNGIDKSDQSVKQPTIAELLKEIEFLKSKNVNINININNDVVDNDYDNDHIDLITNSFFKQKSYNADIDQKPKKVKKHKKSPTDAFKEAADEMFALI
jgi:hypothetical protein